MERTTKRTITLTNHRPVTVHDDEWPIIAEAAGDSFAGPDYSRYRQSLAQGEVDQYHLRVRQHPDGRAIVYGILDAATSRTGSKIRGGEILDGADVTARIPAAIRRVGQHCRIPEAVIQACIADLPALEL